MRTRAIALAGLALALAHWGVVAGQAPAPRDARAPRVASPPRDTSAPPSTVNIPPFIARGRVTDGDDRPLRRARISVQGGEPIEPVMTDDQGRFEMIVPASSGGGLRFTKPGFVPSSITRQVAQASKDLVVRLVKGAAINGTVMDQAGAAVVGVAVRVRRVGDDGRAAAGGQFAAETDDLGEFRVGNLPAGRYAVVAGGQNGGRGGRGGRGGSPRSPSDAPTVQVAAGREAFILVFYESPASVAPLAVVVRLLQAETRGASQVANATMRGRVLGDDATPLKGANVQVTAVDGTGARRSAVTDAEGRYEITGLTAGRYRVRITRSGLPAVEYGQTRAQQLGRIIDVSPNQRLQIDVKMPKSSAVAGTIVDAFGEPLEGASVQVWEARFVEGRTSLVPAGSVRTRRTDDRGRYRLYGLLPGTYYVVASEGTNGSGRGGRGGSNAAGVRVFYPGTALLVHAASIQTVVGLDATGVDIIFNPGRAASVKGLARSRSGQPVRGRAVLAVSQRSGAPAMPLQTTSVDVDGAFEFLDVAPGDYVVQVIDANGSAGGNGRGQARRGGGGARGRAAAALTVDGQASAREFGMQFVTVAEGDEARVVIDTAPGVHMSGRIVLEGDASSVQASSFGVAAYPANLDASPLSGARSLRGTIREDGTFEIRDLVGALRVGQTRAPDGWWLKSVDVNGVNAVNDPAVFSGGTLSASDVSIVFADDAGAIDGRVLDDRRQAVSEFNVLVFAANSDRWFSQSPYVKFGSASQDGTFTVANLPPAEYLVAAVDRIDGGADYGDWQNPAVLSGLTSLARRVSVGSGQRVSTELRLVSSGR